MVSVATAHDPVPRARRRQPRPHGREHAAPGRAAAPVRGAAGRHRHGVPRRASTPATSSSPRRPVWSPRSPPTSSPSRTTTAPTTTYRIAKFRRSNQGTSLQPARRSSTRATRVEVGGVIADGPCTDERRDGARQEPARGVHAVGGPQLRGRDHPLPAPGAGRRPLLDPHRGARGRRPRHQAGPGGDHPGHPERLRGGPRRPRRARHHPHRRRGRAPATSWSARSRPRARPS